MRGFGVTSVSFATETHMSRIAQELGIDPYELRLKNANRIGDTSPNRIVVHRPFDRAGRQGARRAGWVSTLSRTTSDDPRPARRATCCPEHLVGQLGNPEDH